MGIPPITDTHAVFLVLSQLSGAQYVSDCDRRQVAKDSKSFSCSTSRGTGNDKELEDEIESLRKFHESFHVCESPSGRVLSVFV